MPGGYVRVMKTPDEHIQALKARYIPGQVEEPVSYYFSVEGLRYTLVCHPDRCDVVPGPSDGQANVVIKCTQKLFQRVFLDGKMPGPIDIARGRFKTNDVDGLKRLASLFQT